MEGTLRDGEIIVGGDARQRYYDSRGYGRPLSGNDVALSRVEAAHLLFRGDLDSVDGSGFREFLRDSTGGGFGARFLVYANLRERGFYLSPDRVKWVPDPLPGSDFVVYPRGSGPWDDEVEFRVRVVPERETIPASRLGDVVLAVVDEESELTYFETGRPEIGGSTDHDLPRELPGSLLADRVLLWDAPPSIHERAFYGQPLDGRDGSHGAVQLSLVEAAHLVSEGVLSIEHGENEGDRSGEGSRSGGNGQGNGSSESDERDKEAIVARGREVEGDRFDRRLLVYRQLRRRGVVPKTGFKFGADFRTYADVESVDDLGHSENLVRVLPTDHAFEPRDLALDVRLAHGVRKRMIFALVADNERIRNWISVTRLTP